jgi:hypothetical protein
VNASEYGRALKFAAEGEPATPNPADLQHLLKDLHYDQDTKEGGRNADHTKRGVIADRLQEEGRDHEASLLRDGHPVTVDGLKTKSGGGWEGGKVVPYYPSHSWPGGIPLYYHAKDGSVFCPDCADRFANRRARDLAAGEETNDPHPLHELTMGGHEEGPSMGCDECGGEIESAYGDPDLDGHDDE